MNNEKLNFKINFSLRFFHPKISYKLALNIFYRRATRINQSIKKLGDGQLRAFRHIFDEFDIHNTGTITVEELHQIVIKIAGCNVLSFSEVMEVLHGMDVKGTGDIEFDEFIFFMTRPHV